MILVFEFKEFLKFVLFADGTLLKQVVESFRNFEARPKITPKLSRYLFIKPKCICTWVIEIFLKNGPKKSQNYCKNYCTSHLKKYCNSAIFLLFEKLFKYRFFREKVLQQSICNILLRNYHGLIENPQIIWFTTYQRVAKYRDFVSLLKLS